MCALNRWSKLVELHAHYNIDGFVIGLSLLKNRRICESKCWGCRDLEFIEPHWGSNVLLGRLFIQPGIKAIRVLRRISLLEVALLCA